MHVYAFVKTIPGTAPQVAAALVRYGAERAVEVTGPYDVLARFVDVAWEEWAEIKNGATQIAGVVSISTAVVTAPSGTQMLLGNMPFSDPKWGPSGLVLLRVAPAEAEAAWGRLVAARKRGRIKAMVALLGEYDIMAQVSGADEHDIAGNALAVLREIPEIRQATTCLILRGVPADKYVAPPRKRPRGAAARGAGRSSKRR
ncbi:MAG TPA: hypothetical protein VGB64_04610 [Actinomycetota bacterium]